MLPATALVHWIGAFAISRLPPPHTPRHSPTRDQPRPVTTWTKRDDLAEGLGGTVARLRVCSTPGCPTLHGDGGKCAACRASSERQRRPDGNPYSTRGHRLRFRAQVLAAHPYCQCRGECERHQGLCAQRSTVADHWPHERRDLVDMGLDPNDPQYGRGVCVICHNSKTARTSPGGWANRD